MKFIAEYYCWNDGHSSWRSTFDTREEAEDFVFNYWTSSGWYDNNCKESYCDLYECTEIDVSSIYEKTLWHNEGRARGLEFKKQEEIEKKRQAKADADYQIYIALKQKFEEK